MEIMFNLRALQRLLLTMAFTQAAIFCRADGFEPTVTNKGEPPGKAPEGMVWIPGGEFSMGASTNGHGSEEMPMPSNDSEPIHRVKVDGFWMDKTTVSNEEFEKFVKATNYITL